MNVLYVGFKGKNNASYKLLESLKGDKLFLTNSYDGLQRDIVSYSGNYELILMFGIDRTLYNTIRIENMACYDGEEVKTIISTQKINQYFIDNGVDSFVSDVPTAYLCNAAYFYMLKKYNGRVVFLHIPTCKNMSEKTFVKLRKILEEL